MTTLHDPFRRKTVANFFKNLKHRVFPIGRLDYDTDGVLLLTNDGDLAYRLTHPRYQDLRGSGAWSFCDVCRRADQQGYQT